MNSRSQLLVVGVVASLCLFVAVPQAVALIQTSFPLQKFIDESDYLFTATIEKVDPEKPSAIVIVKDQLKGKAPFQRIPINLTGDKQKHTPQLLKRIAPDLPLIVGVKKQPDGKFMMLAFSNGTWFQVLGQTEGEQTRWAFTHCEIYLRRTFAGTTDELKKVLTDVLAGKAKPPAFNPKEPAGFGPVVVPAAKQVKP